jgi:hypothetical protein
MNNLLLTFLPATFSALIGGGAVSHIYKKVTDAGTKEIIAPLLESKVDKEVFDLNMQNLNNQLSEIRSDVKDLVRIHMKE